MVKGSATALGTLLELRVGALRLRSAAVAAGASVDRQGLVLAAVARVGVQFTRLGVLITGGFGEMLGLDGLLLRVGVSLARLRCTFLGFGLGTLCFGGLLVG